MVNKKEAIAELVTLLPMFTGALLGGSNIKAETGLNISEKRTLMYIYMHVGGTMTEYSRRVGLARGSFTTVADGLERKGLVNRVLGVDDRRSYTLVLTEEGKNIAREIECRYKQNIAARLGQLNEEELQDLKCALETIAVIMNEIKGRRKQ